MPTFYEFFAGGGVVRACFLGHKSPIMTQRYAHHYPESLREGVEILERYSLPSTESTNLAHTAQTVGSALAMSHVSG